jgi:mannose-6-phosphate isomerase-like protein (cupin superfamily)
MKNGFFYVLALAPLSIVAPQATSPGAFQFWPASTMNQISQTLTLTAASDPHHFAAQQLGDFPNEAILFVHREADGQPEWHETQVDLVFVQSGSATLIVGGTLINAETVAPHEKRNGTIEGGVRQKVGAGDVLRIPAKTPHQFVLDGSKDLTYIVIKAKGY